LQALPEQMKLPGQVCAAGSTQLSLPSQVPVPTICVPEQVFDPQLKVGYEQSPFAWPTQDPAHAALVALQGVRLPCTAPDTGLQVPGVMSQASHVLLQARLQQ